MTEDGRAARANATACARVRNRGELLVSRAFGGLRFLGLHVTIPEGMRRLERRRQLAGTQPARQDDRQCLLRNIIRQIRPQNRRCDSKS
jgi:hypothetical protein